jgi:hypothetical protein
MKEATTIYELALWKGYLNQAKSEVTNRYDYRVEVPGPVKDSILEYLSSWERAHGQIRRVFGASGGITYGRVACETEKRLVGVLDSVG